MRVLLAFIALSLSTFVLAESVQVEGTGSTKEEARLDAYRIATDRYCGTNILNDRAYDQGSITKDNTTVYSSCRINNAKLLQTSEFENHSQKYKLLYQFEIIRTTEANRLFSNSKDEHHFDTDNVTAQFESYALNKAEGDQYLKNFMSDFPFKAFEIVPWKKPYFEDNSTRDIFLTIPYSFSWNKNYYNALLLTIEKFCIKKKWYQIDSDIQTSGTKTIGVGPVKKFVISDSHTYSLIADYMDSHYPAINIKVYDIYNHLIIDTCTEAVSTVGNYVYGSGYIDDDWKSHRYVSLYLKSFKTEPSKIDGIYLSITSMGNCKSFTRSYY